MVALLRGREQVSLLEDVETHGNGDSVEVLESDCLEVLAVLFELEEEEVAELGLKEEEVVSLDLVVAEGHDHLFLVLGQPDSLRVSDSLLDPGVLVDEVILAENAVSSWPSLGGYCDEHIGGFRNFFR